MNLVLLEEKLIEEIKPMLDKQGFVLFDISLNQGQKVISIDIAIDKPHGGINLDECTFINRQLVEKIDAQVIIAVDYALSVCSPGLDRPLRNQKDFDRVQGKEVRFHLKEKIEGKLEHNGVVENVNEKNVSIKTKKLAFEIPIDKIQKAVQII